MGNSDPVKYRKYMREYMNKKGRQRRSEGLSTTYTSPSVYRRRLRLRAMEVLGGAKCAGCGCDIIDVLQINHVKCNGNKERRQPTYNDKQFFRDIITGRVDKNDYDVRCAVCNVLYYVQSKGVVGHSINWNAVVAQSVVASAS
jgi:hypothetical protein